MADAKLIQRLQAGGIKAPETVIAEARNAGLDLAYACALLDKESGGGANVFGHDRDDNGRYIFPARDGAVAVTEELYREYKRRRGPRGAGGMQGVGPTQLTWWEFQDAADREGGCWKPAVNMRVGFRHLATLMRQLGEAEGAKRYNGKGAAAEAYSADLRARARAWKARLAGIPMPAGPQLLRRGDEGRLVEQLTKRLSYVRRKGSKERYLDGARTRLDAEAEAAVKAFQRDHGLDDDGVVGPKTTLKLNRAVRLETARREKEREKKPADSGGGVTPPPPKRRRARLPALVEALKQSDAETDRAWTAIAAYGSRRQQLLQRLQAKAGEGGGGTAEPPAAVEGMREMTEILLRIEAKLTQLVEVEQRELAAAEPEPPPASGGSGGGVVTPSGSTVVQVVSPSAPPAQAPPDSGPAGNGVFAPPPAPARDLDDLSDAELLQRVERLDRALGRARTVLIRRYISVEAELARLGVRPKEPRKPEKEKKEPRERDPARDESVVLDPGDKAWRIKQSKVALARYLKRHRRETTRGLRRKLLTEVRTPGTARVATPTWERAVREAQAIAKQPVTGRLDEPLEKVLERLWPTEAVMRRVVRATPAWRALPGQVTRNFKLGEFACNDGTPYIDGLVREQGLTKKQAKLRAKQLADRLERLRAREGNRPLRPNSVFRTKTYNAKVGGVPGSAHTRGFAADVPAPAGVTLAAHRAHGRAIFEGGVGIYPTKFFVHFDFDPNETGDNWVG